jgi:hypothetical protein
MNMNKKRYIKPATEELQLELAQMIATSMPLGGNRPADGDSEVLADERDEIVEEGVWGNLWD